MERPPDACSDPSTIRAWTMGPWPAPAAPTPGTRQVQVLHRNTGVSVVSSGRTTPAGRFLLSGTSNPGRVSDQSARTDGGVRRILACP
jgi:multidrug efflux pump subunit AcrA (membrane-fusion protein)